MKKQPHILISAALLAASVQPVFAGLSLTPLQTVVFSQVDDGTFTDFPGPFIGLTAGEPLTGFTKFDPSLGTLKEIRVSAEIAASVDVTLFVDEVTDASQPFTAFFEETGLSFLQAGIVYSPGGGSTGLAVTADLGTIPSVGDFDLDPAAFSSDEFVFYEDFNSEEFGDFRDFGVPSMGVLLADDPDVNLNDFVGTGFVSGLEVDNFLSVASDGVFENLQEAFLEITVALESGEATLQYAYEPVPEPSLYAAIFGMVALAAGYLRRRRRQ